MKKVLLIGTAIAALMGGPAFAADMPLKAPAAPYYSWTGFYIGTVEGVGWGRTEHDFTTGVGHTGGWNISGPLAGGTVGLNWQTGGFVLGVEADGEWAQIKGNFKGRGCNTGNCFTDIRAIGTARAR